MASFISKVRNSSVASKATVRIVEDETTTVVVLQGKLTEATQKGIIALATTQVTDVKVTAKTVLSEGKSVTESHALRAKRAAELLGEELGAK